MITFDVTVEADNGKIIAVFPHIPAQTRKEAINRAIASMTFTAERNEIGEAAGIIKTAATTRKGKN